MLGAHTDSVAAGPGINDNGSGAAALLELAVLLAKHKVRHRVRFCFWTLEETGLLGSKHWVETAAAAELAGVRLYLNFDMIGSPNFKLGAYDGSGRDHGMAGPPGSGHPQALFEAFFAGAAGVNTSRGSNALDGRSDYAPFAAAGVPAGGVFTGADGLKSEAEAAAFGGRAGEPYDANYHLERDDVANVHPAAYLLNVRAIAHALATYANDLGGLPARPARRGARAFRMPLVYGGGCGGHDHVAINEDLPPGGVRESMGFGEVG